MTPEEIKAAAEAAKKTGCGCGCNGHKDGEKPDNDGKYWAIAVVILLIVGFCAWKFDAVGRIQKIV